jgi:DNA cross-link repair 1A protein
MNESSDCHELPDCPGLFIDAFRGGYLKHKVKNAANTFLLSHYHGDHYGNLPRAGKYQGPAKIHCTVITAALLVRVHGVDPSLVVSHALGETWEVSAVDAAAGRPSPGAHAASPAAVSGEAGTIRVTLYDANHCPGAAIILLQSPAGRTHLHTGDLRYHAKMQTYPLLREAALGRRVDCLLLDTTYAHPKHTFCNQQVAVDQIASEAAALLDQQSPQPKTLVLLSCYSIGKEKVLWEVARRTGHKIYANERKRQMLACIQQEESTTPEDDDPHPSTRILDHCTEDADASDVHIVPMGMAGQIWPYFQPNYQACLDYARAQKANYKRVVAFLPTGWAEASNWNKKKAYNTTVKEGVEISVRLVAYSEHSTYPELQSLVEFLQPRLVLPTVYKNEADRRKIQARFRVDNRRAKEAFFRSMVQGGNGLEGRTVNSTSKATSPAVALPMVATPLMEAESPQKYELIEVDSDVAQSSFETKGESDQPVVSTKRKLVAVTCSPTRKRIKLTDVTTLVFMGFSSGEAKEALEQSKDLTSAIDLLLSATPAKRIPAKASLVTTSPKHPSPTQSTLHTSPTKKSVSPTGTRSIKCFFAVKKS